LRTDGADAGRDADVPVRPGSSELRAQLASILESTHFRNSKRSQALLRFVVEAVIEGRDDSLKERTIGASVFGRDAAYDTAQDAIVRNAAVEVRKRLAQYYLEPEHSGDLRIELPLGSYVPLFPVQSAPQVAVAPRVPERNRNLVIPIAAAVAVIAAVAGTIFWLQHRTAVSELDAFWAPLFHDREVIQVCVGQPGRLYRFVGRRQPQLDGLFRGQTGAAPPNLSITPGELEWIAPDYLYMRDAFAAAKVAAWIQAKGYPYQMLSVSRTTYSQLRRNPVVAIGAFDNPWAMRVTAELRFVFDHRTIAGTVYNCVIDRQNPNATDWMIAESVGTATTQDYAIVTRVFDPTTERTVVSVAGIENYGTFAAGEFVTDPVYLGAAMLREPRDWRRKNLQIVLGTKVIERTPGPPKVLAVYSW
jgi:hypothetical protein